LNTLGQRTLLHILSLLAALLMLTACWSDTPAPTPTPTATNAPTPVPSPTSVPTVAPAPSPTPTVVSQSALTNAVASAVTTDRPISATQPVTESQANTATANSNCSQEADLDVAGYPDLKAKMGCPLSAANFDPVGINEFGPGPNFDRFMLWFSNELKIYVLLPNKQWQAYDDTWHEGDPTFTCNPTKDKAKSPPLPRRGFNKIWCTVPNLQETMGTIVVEERQCQHSVVQRFERGRLLACYENATIRYIRLLDDGTWDTMLTR
jgi:hypothetical protein